MKRESINPRDWGLKWGMDQGELVQDVERILHSSGRVSVEPDPGSELGFSVVSPGEIGHQVFGVSAEAAYTVTTDAVSPPGAPRSLPQVVTKIWKLTDGRWRITNVHEYGGRPPGD